MPIEEDVFDPESPDQLTKKRGVCMEYDCATRKFWKALDECQKRIESKEYTAETCHEEAVDWIMALDKCVKAKGFFARIK